MALTDQQLADTRRWCGYPLYGTTQPLNAYQDTVYMQFGMVTMSLHQRLTSLTAEEEAILVDTYLTKLATLETAITDASDNLDTDQAAVWYHNKNEVSDRIALFRQWRRELCSFLGIAPGPGLRQGNSIVRG